MKSVFYVVRVSLVCAVVVLSACASSPGKNGVGSHVEVDRLDVSGIWAMIPLMNGVANVVRFHADGRSELHPYDCSKPAGRSGSNNIEYGVYSVSEDRGTIRVASKERVVTLKVLELKGGRLKATMILPRTNISIEYVKVESVKPICAMYDMVRRIMERAVPHQPADFVSAPFVPDHEGRERYVGEWADDKGNVQIVIRRDTTGEIGFVGPDNDDWKYLYNNVRWENNWLHFTKYSYTEKRELFWIPYHRSVHPHSIYVGEGDEFMRYSLFLGSEREDIMLHRKN